MFVIMLSCLGFIYALLSVSKIVVKLKTEKNNYVFQTSPTQIIIHGTGMVLLIMATYIYYGKEVESWLLYASLACNVIVDFINKGIKVKE